MTKLVYPNTKNCLACDKKITFPRRNQEFCSSECRKIKKYYGTHCEWCDAKLVIPGSKKNETKCCSLSCARQLRYKKENPAYNEDYFTDPNLVNSYWAGFIAADGSVAKVRDTGRLTIKLSSRDKSHLEKIQKEIGAGNIYTFLQTLRGSDKVYEMSRYQLHSDKVFNDLGQVYNVHPAKTLTHKPPDLSGDLAYAFIAGYIDGDGSYSHAKGKYPVLSILGTPEFLSWIYSVYGVNREPKETHTKIHAITFCGDAALKVRESYRNLNLPLLDRKKNRWEEIGLVTDIEDEIEVKC